MTERNFKLRTAQSEPLELQRTSKASRLMNKIWRLMKFKLQISSPKPYRLLLKNQKKIPVAR
jgi:hypothetical protein